MRATLDDDDPLVSPDVLDTLADELEDPVAYATYLRRNHEMWPARYARLSDAIRAGDAEAAMDAVLSLKSACQMIGAQKLVAAARDVERALQDGQMNAAEALLDDLEACGKATMARLSDACPLDITQTLNDTDWTTLAGQEIEVYFPEGDTDAGIVDAVTLDGLILWLKPDGASPRRMVEKLPGVEISCVGGGGLTAPGQAG